MYNIVLSICAPYKEVVRLWPEEQLVVRGEELLQNLEEWVGERLVLFPTEKLKNKIITTFLVANVTKNWVQAEFHKWLTAVGD